MTYQNTVGFYHRTYIRFASLISNNCYFSKVFLILSTVWPWFLLPLSSSEDVATKGGWRLRRQIPECGVGSVVYGHTLKNSSSGTGTSGSSSDICSATTIFGRRSFLEGKHVRDKATVLILPNRFYVQAEMGEKLCLSTYRKHSSKWEKRLVYVVHSFVFLKMFVL